MIEIDLKMLKGLMDSDRQFAKFSPSEKDFLLDQMRKNLEKFYAKKKRFIAKYQDAFPYWEKTMSISLELLFDRLYTLDVIK